VLLMLLLGLLERGLLLLGRQLESLLLRDWRRSHILYLLLRNLLRDLLLLLRHLLLKRLLMPYDLLLYHMRLLNMLHLI
jgi:hypothetical protein